VLFHLPVIRTTIGSATNLISPGLSVEEHTIIGFDFVLLTDRRTAFRIHPSCHCLTNRSRICFELIPVHRIGPSDAVRVYRLKHNPLAHSSDVPHTLASMKCLRMAPIATQDCDWSLKSASFHKVPLASCKPIPVTAAWSPWTADAAASVGVGPLRPRSCTGAVRILLASIDSP